MTSRQPKDPAEQAFDSAEIALARDILREMERQGSAGVTLRFPDGKRYELPELLFYRIEALLQEGSGDSLEQNISEIEAARALDTTTEQLNDLMTQCGFSYENNEHKEHRQVSRQALEACRAKLKKQREEALNEIVRLSEEMGLYD
jgi:citrate lyase beta subunit